jgi:hypothetical protein
MIKGYLPIIAPWGSALRVNSLLTLALLTIPCKSKIKLRQQRFKLNQRGQLPLWRAWKLSFRQHSPFLFSSRLKEDSSNNRYLKIQKYRLHLCLKVSKTIVCRFLRTGAPSAIMEEEWLLTNNSNKSSLLSKLLHQTSSHSFRDLYRHRKTPLARHPRLHLSQIFTMLRQEISRLVHVNKSTKIR